MRRELIAIGCAARAGFRQKILGARDAPPGLAVRRCLRQDVHGQIARFDELFGARGERLTDAAVGGRGHGAGARFALAPFDERGRNVVSPRPDR